MYGKKWTFLEAYDFIKANPSIFTLCEDEEELSGIHPCICVYEKEFVGKLRWRTPDSDFPSVDESLQNLLNQYDF